MDYEEFNNECFSSDFDDRIDAEIKIYLDENDDSECIKEDDGFYRHLDEY